MEILIKSSKGWGIFNSLDLGSADNQETAAENTKKFLHKSFEHENWDILKTRQKNIEIKSKQDAEEFKNNELYESYEADDEITDEDSDKSDLEVAEEATLKQENSKPSENMYDGIEDSEDYSDSYSDSDYETDMSDSDIIQRLFLDDTNINSIFDESTMKHILGSDILKSLNEMKYEDIENLNADISTINIDPLHSYFFVGKTFLLS